MIVRFIPQVLASRARVVPPIASGGGGVNAMDMSRGGREPRGEGCEGAAVGGIESGTTDVGAGARDAGPAQERELNETYSKRDFEQLVRDREVRLDRHHTIFSRGRYG